MAKRVSHRARSGFWAEVEITQGNIDNDHLYLGGFLERFPADLIGGTNKTALAPKTALVDWGGPAPVETDIEGGHKFFRARPWVGDFYARNGAADGDTVRIEETAPYRYRVTLVKKGAR